MFVNPVVYPARVVPEEWRWLLSAQSDGGMIDGFRAAIFGDRPGMLPGSRSRRVMALALFVARRRLLPKAERRLRTRSDVSVSRLFVCIAEAA